MAKRRDIEAELVPAPPADPELWGRRDVKPSEAWRKVTEILLRAEARLAAREQEQQATPARLRLVVPVNASNATTSTNEEEQQDHDRHGADKHIRRRAA